MLKIVMIGAGNVGFHLGKALSLLPDIEVVQVYSRTKKKALNSAQNIDCQYTTKIINIHTDADLYIIAVKDTAIGTVAKALSTLPHLKEKLVVHTSGATPSTVLLPHLSRIGIFYPLQTFSIQKEPNFRTIPFCLDAVTEEDFLLLENLAQQLSTRTERIDDAQRAVLHVAAVFVNNFTNYLYTIGADITEKSGVPFDLLKPLIAETAEKIRENTPKDMQTGPAVRRDKATIDRHLEFLEGSGYEGIYEVMTSGIGTLK
ncbi:MAG: putative short-subunit dehydrogenase-like oxidoreductase (DUF2520 family) [Saprospiraceae bacterium]|jgi:predicted short-subunit dehydrogenase-like oxidoreductase (DUF2520 family)